MSIKEWWGMTLCMWLEDKHDAASRVQISWFWLTILLVVSLPVEIISLIFFREKPK